MGEHTKIEWCDYTFNPWIGCSKVAAGCANCYAEADMDKRRKRVRWGPHGTRSRTTDQYWHQPLKWNRFATEPVASALRCDFPRRPRVFCASLADVFEEWDGPIVDAQGRTVWRYLTVLQWRYIGCEERPSNVDCEPATMADLRADLFALIDATPNLDWLLVTKRPENIMRMWGFTPGIPAKCMDGDTIRYDRPTQLMYRPNVWLLTSVARQADADRNIPELLKCRDLAPVLGVSAEPLLEQITLDTLARGGPPRWLTGEPEHNDPTIDWVIAGGESGPGARPCAVGHVRSLVQQCHSAGVPCFVKQLGANVVNREGERCPRVKHPKGGDPAEWPEDLRVRQFPQSPVTSHESPTTP